MSHGKQIIIIIIDFIIIIIIMKMLGKREYLESNNKNCKYLHWNIRRECGGGRNSQRMVQPSPIRSVGS